MGGGLRRARTDLRGGRPGDGRPRDLIARARAFACGQLAVGEGIRRRFVGGVPAGEVRAPAAAAAARSAGQAAATAHMGAHALGAAAYAAKAAGLAAPDQADAVSDEVCWQLDHMSPAVRAALQLLPPVGENAAGPLGPGLLASGPLAAIIRDLRANLTDSNGVPQRACTTGRGSWSASGHVRAAPSALCKSEVVPRLVAPVLARGSMADHAQPVLIVDELTLRPWTAAHVPAVVDAYTDPLIRRWHLRTMTRDEAQEWVIAAGQGWTDESAASWAITTSSGIVGRMTLGAIDLGGAEADVRYWVVPSARGRRVASRALNALTDWATTDLGLHRVELEHSTSNVPSCRVAERAEYALEGTRRSQLLHEDGWHDMHLHAYLSQAETE